VAQLARALGLLHTLGALDDRAELTVPVGRLMCELPLEPCLARMLLYAGGVGVTPSSTGVSHVKCSEEAITLAAMLSVDNIFITPSTTHGRHVAEQTKLHFAVHEGDPLTLINVYNAFAAVRRMEPAAWAKRYYLNLRALARAKDIRAQLRRYMLRCSVPLVSCGDNAIAIRRAVCAGFFVNAAQLQSDGSYQLVRQPARALPMERMRAGGVAPPTDGSAAAATRLQIHPTSVLHASRAAGQKPAWVVFHDVHASGQTWMRDVCVIEPQWLVEIAPHYFEWESGFEAHVLRFEATVAAAESEMRRAAAGGDALEFDGVVAEPGKKHRRLF
jgi:ATP-dependent RNA helicase DDX35